MTEKEFTEQELKLAFPDVDCQHTPLGSRCVVQIRSVAQKSRGGIILSAESKDAEKWNQQTAKIVAIGDVAFRNRGSGEEWFEGAWFKVGDFVRIPKYNQDKWIVEAEVGETDVYGNPITSDVLFMLINDMDILAKVNVNPLKIKAYL